MDRVTDDEFVSILSSRRQLGNEVVFDTNQAKFPVSVIAGFPERMTWQWNRNGTLRARFCADGELPVRTGVGVGKQARVVSATGMYGAIGAKLRGRYPIAKIDGHDIYIDVSAAVAQ